MIFSCFEQYVNFESVWSGRLTFRNFAEKNLLSLFLCLLLFLPLSSFFLTLPLTLCLSHSLAFYFAFSLSPSLLTLIFLFLYPTLCLSFQTLSSRFFILVRIISLPVFLAFSISLSTFFLNLHVYFLSALAKKIFKFECIKFTF